MSEVSKSKEEATADVVHKMKYTVRRRSYREMSEVSKSKEEATADVVHKMLDKEEATADVVHKMLDKMAQLKRFILVDGMAPQIFEEVMSHVPDDYRIAHVYTKAIPVPASKLVAGNGRPQMSVLDFIYVILEKF
jgi:hypothetical protein